MTRVAVVRNTGMNVQPIDESHTRPARMASDLTVADGITVRAFQATVSSSGCSFSLFRSDSHGSSRRGITNDLDSRRARFVCQAIGDPRSERRTLESSRLSPVFRGSSLELRMSLLRWLRGGYVMQVSPLGRGGDIETYLSMRMRRFSGLQMRMNEWVREGADYYSFLLCHMLVGRCPMYCLLDLFLSLLFYYPPQNCMCSYIVCFLCFLRNRAALL